MVGVPVAHNWAHFRGGSLTSPPQWYITLSSGIACPGYRQFRPSSLPQTSRTGDEEALGTATDHTPSVGGDILPTRIRLCAHNLVMHRIVQLVISSHFHNLSVQRRPVVRPISTSCSASTRPVPFIYRSASLSCFQAPIFALRVRSDMPFVSLAEPSSRGH